MSNGDKLIISIDGDDSKYRKKLETLGGVAATSLKVVTAGVTAVTGALATAATAGMVYNSQMEGYNMSFSTMLGSADNANKLMDDLKKTATSTPLEMPTLAKGTQTLLALMCHHMSPKTL